MAFVNIFSTQEYRAAALEERGISSEDLALMNIRERGDLLDAIEAERQGLVADWEEQLCEDL